MTLGILLAGGAAPLVIELAGGGRRGYAVMSFSLAAICLGAMLLSFWGTAKAPFLSRVETTLPFKEQMGIALKNRPFLPPGLRLLPPADRGRLYPGHAALLRGAHPGRFPRPSSPSCSSA